jgi:hypothetical protein
MSENYPVTIVGFDAIVQSRLLCGHCGTAESGEAPQSFECFRGTHADHDAHTGSRSRDNMKRGMVRPRSLLLLPILVASLVSGNGCSMLIASRGVTSLPTITTGSTRQEVRQTLGDPESSETRGDGTRIDTYRIRRKGTSAWGPDPLRKMDDMATFTNVFQGFSLVLTPAAILIFEGYAIGKAIADSEKGVQTLTLVYGPDGRLLFSYDVNLPAGSRFDAACRPLNAALWAQLENDQCPTWSTCFASYLDERRKRAVWVGYTLPPTDDANSQRLVAVATDRDEGRMTKGEALIRSAGLYVLDETVPSKWRFSATRDSLNGVVWTQIENDGCPAWLPCFTAYVDELRRRAAVVGYTLSPADEETSRRLLDVARDRDEGRITEGEAHIGIAGYEVSHWSLDQALRMQLKTDCCPGWLACVTYHENDRRRRAASENSTITPEEESQMRLRREIADDVDQGRITKADVLEEERWRNF